jgi:predicted ATP-grasp superfamily ATP-dependent carboligase
VSVSARPAVVVNVRWVPGVSTVAALGRAGVPVHAVDDVDALGFRSRYVDAAHRSPTRGDDEAAWIRFLAELGDGLAEPAPIFLLDDDELNAVARNRDVLGDRFLYPFPRWETLGPLQDKRHQIEHARALGIPVPRASAEPTDDFGFPVLVKPVETGAFRRSFGVKAFRCENRAELGDAWERARGHGTLVWEWIPGGDEALYTLGAYVSREGEALGVFSGRKLVQDPPGLGNARAAEALWVDEVVERGLELLRSLDFHGPAQVEFKRDPRDGAYKLIEVNPRLWQWHGLAERCGVNLPYIAYRDLLGDPTPPARMQRDARNRWSITFKSNRRPLPLRPRYVDPLLARDDPRVALAHLTRVARDSLTGRWPRSSPSTSPTSSPGSAGSTSSPAQTSSSSSTTSSSRGRARAPGSTE